MFGRPDKKESNKEKKEKLLQKHTELKREFMKDEEIDQAYESIENIRRSHRDKDNKGLIDLWREADDYWEGNSNQPVDDADPASNINIVHPNVEGQVALLVEKNITAYVEPVSLSEVPFVKPVNIIMQWVIEKNKMRKKLDMTWRHLKKKGMSILRVLWDNDFMNGFGMPEIGYVNPQHFYIDPNITEYTKMQEAEYIAEAIPSSIHMAKLEYGEEKSCAIIPDYEPFEDAYGFENNNNETKNKYIKFLYWNKEKNEEDDIIVRLRVYSGCGVLLFDSNEEKQEAIEVNIEIDGEDVETKVEKNKKITLGFYPSCNKYLYHITPCYPRDNMLWGKGEVELLMEIQDLINDLDDQIRINARLTGNPQKLIDTSSGIDPDKVTNEAGLNIPTNNINAIKYLQPPSIPSYIPQRRNQALQYERPLLTRFNDQMVGQRVQGVDTATESLQLSQSGMAGIDHSKALFEETFSDIMEQCFDLLSYYWDKTQAFKIAGENETENDFTFFRGSDLSEISTIVPASLETIKENNNRNTEIMKDDDGNPLTKKAEFDFYVRVGSGMPKNKSFLYNVIKESFIAGAIDVGEYRGFLQSLMNLPIEKVNPTIEAMQTQMKMQNDGLKKQQRQQLLEAPVGSGSQDTQGLDQQEQVDRRAVSTGTGPTNY